MIVSYKGEEIQFAVEIEKSNCPDEGSPPETIVNCEKRYRSFFQSLMYGGLFAIYSGPLMNAFHKDFHSLVEKYRGLLEEGPT